MNYRSRISVLVLGFAVLMCPALQAASIYENWTIEKTFKDPESVAYDTQRDVIYVSNVNQYALDNNGFISKVSTDGKQITLKWVVGLHSPTGMAIHNDILYVADVDALVAINLKQQKIIKRYHAPDKKPVLNDVAISPQGTVYVSGSASRKIYQLESGKLVVWVSDTERLKFANGLLVENKLLIHGGLHWTAFDRQDKSIVTQIVSPPEQLKDFDGITSDGNGGYFVTLIDDSRIWHLKKSGKHIPLSEKEINGIDLQYLPKEKRLIVPRVGGGLSVYKIGD